MYFQRLVLILRASSDQKPTALPRFSKDVISENSGRARFLIGFSVQDSCAYGGGRLFDGFKTSIPHVGQGDARYRAIRQSRSANSMFDKLLNTAGHCCCYLVSTNNIHIFASLSGYCSTDLKYTPAGEGQHGHAVSD